MSALSKLLSRILGESNPGQRSGRREPQLPQQLFMIPERGPSPQAIPVPVKARR